MGICESSNNQASNPQSTAMINPTQQQGNTLTTIATVANTANALNSNNQQQGNTLNTIANVANVAGALNNNNQQYPSRSPGTLRYR